MIYSLTACQNKLREHLSKGKNGKCRNKGWKKLKGNEKWLRAKKIHSACHRCCIIAKGEPQIWLWVSEENKGKNKPIIRFTMSTKWKQTLQELCLIPAKREHWGNLWETSLGKDLRVWAVPSHWFGNEVGFPGGSNGKEYTCMWEIWVLSLGQEDPLEKGMATYCSILAWRIPWTEEHGRLQYSGNS